MDKSEFDQLRGNCEHLWTTWTRVGFSTETRYCVKCKSQQSFDASGKFPESKPNDDAQNAALVAATVSS